jgi:D-beta-D-heptose 7-phosphate kinase/D-beta-D-heptose 1-phosphate adenosyltransferase
MIRVIGDVMLDRWISGSVDRISPEAPVPVLLEHSVESSLGGAANVAVNLSNLKQDIVLYGDIGGDDEGIIVKNLLLNYDIGSMMHVGLEKTTVKTRIIDKKGKCLLRVDSECKCKSDASSVRLLEDVNDLDIVVISDYDKGVIKDDSLEKISNKTNFIYVDPKKEPEHYFNAYLVKPNMKEYVGWNGVFDKDSALSFMKKYEWNWMAITDGGNGIHLLSNNNEYYHYQEKAKEVVDVVGAGDVVISVLAYGHSVGMSVQDSCQMACYAASISVGESGISRTGFRKIYKNDK